MKCRVMSHNIESKFLSLKKKPELYSLKRFHLIRIVSLHFPFSRLHDFFFSILSLYAAPDIQE